jgi:hypothetical protein
VYHSQRSLVRGILPVKSPQAIHVAEFLADNLSSPFRGMVPVHIINQEDATMFPTLVSPFFMPLKAGAMLPPVIQGSVSARTSVRLRSLVSTRCP